MIEYQDITDNPPQWRQAGAWKMVDPEAELPHGSVYMIAWEDGPPSFRCVESDFTGFAPYGECGAPVYAPVGHHGNDNDTITDPPTAARVLQMIGDLEREVGKLHDAAPEVVTVPAVDGEEEHLLCPSCGERPDEWFELDFDYRVNSAQDEEGTCRVYQGDPCHETLAFACGECDALVRIPDDQITWN